MKNYLVPVDGSEGSRRALHYAKERARVSQARIHVLHVEAPLRYDELRVYATRKEFHQLRHEACKRLLSEAVEVLQDSSIPHETHMQEGEPAQTIARFVEAQKMDEVIMSTRGMGAIGQMLLGSVAQRVVHLVHVPVTLVK